MKELEKILQEILSRYDLSKPEGRDAAYEECVDFAETRLTDDLRCNTFLRMAAQTLEKESVEFDIIRDMVEMHDDAVIDIAYDDRQGFLLTANSAGLEYLADLFRVLAEAPEGEHIHFYNDERPLTSMSFNAVFYHESEEWFQRAEEEATADSGQEPARKRTIRPEEIFAVQVVGNLPADIPITRDRIYKVERFSTSVPDTDGDVIGEGRIWRKSCAGITERNLCFEIADDFGDDIDLILHLDDPDVIYFKREDLEFLLG